jgi:hypothetical protein
MAGSLILNKGFEEALKNIVGDENFLKLKKTEGFADAMKQFDREVKPAFRGDPDQAWNVNFTMANLEDHPEDNLISNCLRLKKYVFFVLLAYYSSAALLTQNTAIW